MDSAFQVFAVDDDPIVLRAIERMLRSHSIAVEGFTSPEAFLAQPLYDGVACLLRELSYSFDYPSPVLVVGFSTIDDGFGNTRYYIRCSRSFS